MFFFAECHGRNTLDIMDIQCRSWCFPIGLKPLHDAPTGKGSVDGPHGVDPKMGGVQGEQVMRKT